MTRSPLTLPRRLVPLLQAILAALLFGASAPFAKLLLRDEAPIPLAGFLYLGAGLGALLLLGVQRLVARRSGVTVEAGLKRPDWPWLAGAVVAGGFAAPIVLLFGLRATPAATASLLLNFEGVATAVIAALAFRESIGGRVWGAIGLITAASILLSWDAAGAWGFSLGALGVLGACVLWGVDNNLTRRISAKNPLAIVAIKGLGAGTCSVLLALALGQGITPARAAGALLLGSVSYGLSTTLFIFALRELGAGRTSAVFGSAPFLGMVLSLLIFREIPGWLFWAAVPLMAGGATLVLGEQHRHVHEHPTLVHEHRHRHDEPHHQHPHQGAEVPPAMAHSHVHNHEPTTHVHPHVPDIHHRHEHGG